VDLTRQKKALQRLLSVADQRLEHLKQQGKRAASLFLMLVKQAIQQSIRGRVLLRLGRLKKSLKPDFRAAELARCRTQIAGLQADQG
jgi:Tfp pilus assembly pilus retraction ATPase PilT